MKSLKAHVAIPDCFSEGRAKETGLSVSGPKGTQLFVVRSTDRLFLFQVVTIKLLLLFTGWARAAVWRQAQAGAAKRAQVLQLWGRHPSPADPLSVCTQTNA